ncbi:TPA: phosphonate ABC transporter, permease protein PhnE, partial [Klebsiella pneumoniae]|nr:phosphonate ABC transporter, permease protein PhnE [Klebsiella pneumoniae]
GLRRAVDAPPGEKQRDQRCADEDRAIGFQHRQVADPCPAEPQGDQNQRPQAAGRRAVVFSLVVAFVAARNTAPHPLVFGVARVLLNALRSVPELIMGIIFVAAVGFGALPGVLALGLHSVGMVSKFFAEAIEHVDEAPVEAARAAGATPMQVLLHAVLPQVTPQFADVAIYRWEYNFRASTVMGMVGAGGIGFELMGSLRIMQYQEVAAILLVILAMVTLVDAFSGVLRKRFK